MIMRSRRTPTSSLLLLFRCSFLRHSLLSYSFFLRRSMCLRLVLSFVLNVLHFHRRSLLHLGFLFRKLRRLETLPIECNLGDAHRGERLSMSTQLLVLFLALVMEDENFLGASLLDDLAAHVRAGLRQANLTIAAGNRQHIAELDFAVCIGLGLQANHISGRHSVLLSTGADDRVHTYASIKTHPVAYRRDRGNC